MNFVCLRALAFENETYEDNLAECDQITHSRSDSAQAEAFRCYVDLLKQGYQEYQNNKSCASSSFLYNAFNTIIEKIGSLCFLDEGDMMKAKAASVLPQGTMMEVRERLRDCEILLAEEKERAERKKRMAEKISRARREMEKVCTEKLHQFAQGRWLEEKGTPVETKQALNWFYYRLSTSKSLEDSFHRQFESCMENPQSFNFTWPADSDDRGKHSGSSRE